MPEGVGKWTFGPEMGKNVPEGATGWTLGHGEGLPAGLVVAEAVTAAVCAGFAPFLADAGAFRMAFVPAEFREKKA